MSVDRDDALRSALKRLPLAVVIVDGAGNLSAFNQRAVELFERESLLGDLVRSRPSHALSSFILKLLGNDEAGGKEQLTFPSGRMYAVEPSRRSSKGRGRWLMLLIEPAVSKPATDPSKRWDLTEREADVARMLTAGKQTDEICDALGFAPNTLKTHVKSLLAKTASRSRTELVAKLLGSTD
jgi:DNA-binding CsgD family transcriptional regulator